MASTVREKRAAEGVQLLQAVTQTSDLLQLAAIASADHGRLGEIYTAITRLFEAQSSALSQRERELAADICRRLSKDVEMSIRLSLAERLADSETAPRELVLLLADDRIEVATPVLLRSRALVDDDLLRVVRNGSTEHQFTVASREEIGEAVTAALADSDSDIVVVALVRNKTAKIGQDTFQVLTQRAITVPALQEPLVLRPDLPQSAATRLLGLVSDALKTALMQRYPAAASSLAQAVEESTQAVRSGAASTSEANAVKLIAKLAAGDQLRASFLVRVLHQGQMDLFEHGFAALTGLDIDTMRAALYISRPATVAKACRAVGIDKSVFQTIFSLSRQARGYRAAIDGSEQRELDAAFSLSKADALAALKAAL